MGGSRLMRELVWRGQLHVSVFRARASQPPSQLLAAALGLPAPVRSQRAVLTALGVLAERGEPLLIAVEDWERLDVEERDVVTALARSLESRGSLALLVSGESAP